MQSNISSHLQKMVETYLKRGVSFYQAASNLATYEIATIYQMGADQLWTAGWLGGFNRENKLNKFLEDRQYNEGYDIGFGVRCQLEKKYLN